MIIKNNNIRSRNNISNINTSRSINSNINFISMFITEDPDIFDEDFLLIENSMGKGSYLILEGVLTWLKTVGDAGWKHLQGAYSTSKKMIDGAWKALSRDTQNALMAKASKLKKWGKNALLGGTLLLVGMAAESQMNIPQTPDQQFDTWVIDQLEYLDGEAQQTAPQAAPQKAAPQKSITSPRGLNAPQKAAPQKAAPQKAAPQKPFSPPGSSQKYI